MHNQALHYYLKILEERLHSIIPHKKKEQIIPSHHEKVFALAIYYNQFRRALS